LANLADRGIFFGIAYPPFCSRSSLNAMLHILAVTGAANRSTARWNVIFLDQLPPYRASYNFGGCAILHVKDLIDRAQGNFAAHGGKPAPHPSSGLLLPHQRHLRSTSASDTSSYSRPLKRRGCVAEIDKSLAGQRTRVQAIIGWWRSQRGTGSRIWGWVVPDWECDIQVGVVGMPAKPG